MVEIFHMVFMVLKGIRFVHTRIRYQISNWVTKSFHWYEQSISSLAVFFNMLVYCWVLFHTPQKKQCVYLCVTLVAVTVIVSLSMQENEKVKKVYMRPWKRGKNITIFGRYCQLSILVGLLRFVSWNVYRNILRTPLAMLDNRTGVIVRINNRKNDVRYL